MPELVTEANLEDALARTEALLMRRFTGMLAIGLLIIIAITFTILAQT